MRARGEDAIACLYELGVLLEEIKDRRIPFDQDEDFTPKHLRDNKEYLIRFRERILKGFCSQGLGDYTKKLTEVIEQYEPKNILQGLLCSNADKELLEQFKYKKDQMEAFSEIVQGAHKKQQAPALLGNG